MQKMLALFSTVVVTFIIFTSCATSRYDHGRSFLRSEQYAKAIQLFLIEVGDDSLNYKLWRDLGIAYFQTGKQDSALSSLDKAFQLNPKDGSTIFYLGSVHSRNKDYLRAITYYRQYTKVGRLKRIRRQIEESLKSSIRELYRQETLARLDEPNPGSIPDSTIAVLYFKNLNHIPQWDPMQKGLAEVLSYYLSKIKALRVLERVRLQVVLEELDLVEAGEVTRETAPQVGMLLGARTLVSGSFVALDSSSRRIQIDAGLISTQTRDLQMSDKVTGNMDDFVRLQKRIVRNVLDQLNIPLTEEELESIEAPTEDRLAFMAFSKALDLEDQGILEEARKSYSNALSHDPDFTMAEDKVNEVDTRLQEAAIEISELEPVLFPTFLTEDQRTRGRLGSSGAQVNAGIVPGQDERDSVQEAGNEEGFAGVPVNIEIVIPRNLNKGNEN